MWISLDSREEAEEAEAEGNAEGNEMEMKPNEMEMNWGEDTSRKEIPSWGLGPGAWGWKEGWWLGAGPEEKEMNPAEGPKSEPWAKKRKKQRKEKGVIYTFFGLLLSLS